MNELFHRSKTINNDKLKALESLRRDMQMKQVSSTKTKKRKNGPLDKQDYIDLMKLRLGEVETLRFWKIVSDKLEEDRGELSFEDFL